MNKTNIIKAISDEKLRGLYKTYVLTANISALVLLAFFILLVAVLIVVAFNSAVPTIDLAVGGGLGVLSLIMLTIWRRWVIGKMSSIERFYDVQDHRHALRREFSHKWFKWLHPTDGCPID